MKNYLRIALCRSISSCTTCLKSGCVWLNSTILPCRMDFQDVDDQPKGWATSVKDCKSYGFLPRIINVTQSTTTEAAKEMQEEEPTDGIFYAILGGTIITVGLAVAFYWLRIKIQGVQDECPTEIEMVKLEK